MTYRNEPTHPALCVGTQSFPMGRWDITPRACCGLFGSLLPVKRPIHNTLTESLWWLTTDALLGAPGWAERCCKGTSVWQLVSDLVFSVMTQNSWPQVRVGKNTPVQHPHHSCRWTNPSKHPPQLLYTPLSTHWWWWNMLDRSTLSFPLSASMEAPEKHLSHHLDCTLICAARLVHTSVTLQPQRPDLHTHVGTSCHSTWGTSAKLSAPSGYRGALKSVHLISTSSINARSLTLKGSFQFQPMMDGLVAQAGGMMNSNQRAPLGLLSMGYFLKHLLPGYPSSDDQRSRQKEWRSQPWGLWQWADTFWGFHRHILSLHDQSDSGTCRCALTRTVFTACNKSMISSDDRRMRWWISAQAPRVYCTARFMWPTRSMEVVPVKRTSSIKAKCIAAPPLIWDMLCCHLV